MVTTDTPFTAGQSVIYLSPNGSRWPARIVAVIRPLRGAVCYRVDVLWDDGTHTTIRTTADRLERSS